MMSAHLTPTVTASRESVQETRKPADNEMKSDDATTHEPEENGYGTDIESEVDERTQQILDKERKAIRPDIYRVKCKDRSYSFAISLLTPNSRPQRVPGEASNRVAITG